MPGAGGQDGAGGGAGAGGQGGAPGSNPYAHPDSPYNVQRASSTKLTEPLINTPRTVTVVPKEVIADKGATSFRELVRTTAGMTLGTGEGGNAFGDRAFVRGFDTRNDVYVDGVRDPGVSIRETFQLEQVEVLKGPSATVGGRGTSGGAINLVTKKPFFQNLHEAEVTVGTDQTRRLTFDINRVLSPTVAVRAVGMGQIANVAGRDYVFDNRFGGLLAVTWKPSDRFKMTVDIQRVNLDQLPDWGIPFDARSRMPFTESGLPRSNYYGIPNRDFQRLNQDIVSLSTESKLTEWLTATTKLRYGRTDLDYVVGAPGAPNLSNANPTLWTVNSTAKSRRQTNEILAKQTDLTAKFSTFGLLHTMVAGVELSREDVWRDTYSNLNTETNVVGAIPGVTMNLWNPNAGSIPWTTALVLAGRPTTIRVDTVSAYVLDTINWREKLFVTAGLRFDDYRIGATSVGANNAITRLSRHDGIWNWNIGVTYKIVPNGAIYAAYGTSSNPVGSELDGGGNDYGGLTAQNAVLGPERNTAREIGTKWEFFDKRLLVTAALFETIKDGARETQGAGAAATIVPTGRYRVRGLDIGIGGKLTDRLSVFGGMVIMDTKVLASNNIANIGLTVANLAQHSYNLLVRYQLTDSLNIGGQVSLKDKIRGGTMAANQNIAPGGRARLDAFAEYEIIKGVTAKLAVYNMTNAVLYDAFYRSGTPYVYIAPGRSATASLKFKF